jgi:DNA-binding NarL/FixJ family response regulator
MPKKKKYEYSVPLPYYRVATGTTVFEALRGLINGLFGAPRPYTPSVQEIADYYLTPREREIAYLAALGFSDSEIADALAVNFQTVRTHLRSILHKMQVEDPRELREYFSKRTDSAN